MSFSLSRLLEPDPKKTSTEQKLVDLGLISASEASNTVKKPKSSHMTRKYHSPQLGADHGRPPLPPTPSSRQTQGTGVTPNFKKHSISSGTIPRRSNSTTPRRLQSQPPPQPASNHSRSGSKDSSLPGGRMVSMLDTDRARSRNERTFVGGACAACEELLEHTLSGERILQFSCGHVAHEACFYEYLRNADTQYCPSCDAPLGLDSARGGNILDLNKLSSMVRAIAQAEPNFSKTVIPTPLAWDGRPATDERTTSDQHYLNSHNPHRDSRDSQRMRIEKLALVNGHSRNNSDHAPTADISTAETISSHGRRHDYDVHAMETALSETQSPDLRNNNIPAPLITIRSEFPTLVRSRQQQSLACLVTVEVPERKSKPWSAEFTTSPLMSMMPPPPKNRVEVKPVYSQRVQESQEALERVTLELQQRVENWHGLEFDRFGPLRLHSPIRVGKDRQSWQELQCYLFGEMLICVKEKRNNQSTAQNGRPVTRAALKGSILIRRHLRHVQAFPNDLTLTLTLTVAELPTFHLQFQNVDTMEIWNQALLDLDRLPETLRQPRDFEQDASGTEDEEWGSRGPPGPSSSSSSYGQKTNTTAPTEYSHRTHAETRMSGSLHVPLDIVVVIPVSSSMQGLKISLLRDTLRFLVHNLGEKDRMGLVTFGSGAGAVPLVGMTTKSWPGWNKVLASIRPVGQKSLRADAVEGANIAMDLLMQRKGANPISSILLVSDSSTADAESIDFVVQRAEAAKVGIYTFGLGLTHKPDSMIEMSTRTKASYTYVKDWMMLRECISGCLGALQSISHLGARIRIRLPDGSPAKFVKISGALQTTRRATGRDAEAVLGDLRFGDKRDVLVQLVVDPDNASHDQYPQDHWESIVSGLEALGGSSESDESRVESVEEVPLLQADLIYGDLQKDGSSTQLSRPSLLTITILPPTPKTRSSRPTTPPIPPHPSIVQRRMELLTSDMLTRALTLVSRNQHERAHHLLNETRTVLKGLGKGSLPPLPTQATSATSKRTSPAVPPKPSSSSRSASPDSTAAHLPRREKSPGIEPVGTPPRTPMHPPPPPPRATPIDQVVMSALDSELEAALEWINHPAVFSRDSRKAVLQAIGVISSQRAYTMRSTSEALLAERIVGIRNAIERSREWRESEDQDALAEEQ